MCVCVWLMVPLQRAAVSSRGGGKKTFHVKVSLKAAVECSLPLHRVLPNAEPPARVIEKGHP